MFRISANTTYYIAGLITSACIVYSIWCMHPCLFPNCGTELFLGSISLWAIVSVIYHNSNKRSIAGWYTLLIATSILISGIILNLEHFSNIFYDALNGKYTGTQINGLTNPDSMRYWNDALYHFSDGREGSPTWFHQQGYGLIISLMWQLCGQSIVYPLLLNALLILLAIILCGKIATRLIDGNKDVMTVSMVMTASICYFLNSGTVILKEAPLCFAFALSLYGLTLIVKPTEKHKVHFLLWTSVIIGLSLVAILRYTFLLYLILAIPFLYIKRRSLSLDIIAVSSISLMIFFAARLIIAAHSPSISEPDIISGNGLSNNFFYSNPQHAAYNTIMNGYFDYPWWEKAALLPVTATVQFFVPLPWGFDLYSNYAPTLAYARIGYPWYIVGGLAIYTLVFCRKHANSEIFRFLLWACAMWFATAYLFAGTVSRYTLPLIPAIIPAAVYAYYDLRQRKHPFLFVGIYIMLVAIILLIAHHIQHDSL